MNLANDARSIDYADDESLGMTITRCHAELSGTAASIIWPERYDHRNQMRLQWQVNRGKLSPVINGTM